MNQRRKDSARPASKTRGKTRPGRRGPRAGRWWLAALPAAAIAVWFVASTRTPRPRAVALATDPTAGLDAAQANDAGLAIARAGRPLDALPYMARAAALAPGLWFVHQNYAGALGNAAQQARLHLGKEEIATRSSVERVALLRVSLREMTSAESLASVAADRGVVVFERGRAFQTWGFPLDALKEFRRAMTHDPSSRMIAETVAGAERAIASGGRIE